MRILFITNFYPPARPGGYTQWCHEVATALKYRNHQISVITSLHELDKVTDPEENIHRLLHIDGDLEYYNPIRFFITWRNHQHENSMNLKYIVEEFNPDIIFIWGMWSMSKSIPALAEELLPAKVVYFISDYWPESEDMHSLYWKNTTQHWYSRLPKQLLGSIALKRIENDVNHNLKFDNAICVSAAVKRKLLKAGIPLSNARIIHGGTDINRFSDIPCRDFSRRPLNLLYAGQLVTHKGVHTAIEAMAHLLERKIIDQVKLSIVGSGHPEYEQYLRDLVEEYMLHDYVTFYGQVTKYEIPNIMQQSHILIFPSIYEEPFARMTQEAMLAGLVVVGTTTGGTKEIIINNNNGLTFEKENSHELSLQILRLINDPALCQRLSEAGRSTVLNNFTLDRMVDDIENYLSMVLSRNESPVSH